MTEGQRIEGQHRWKGRSKEVEKIDSSSLYFIRCKNKGRD
jgi:hypothetical protein